MAQKKLLFLTGLIPREDFAIMQQGAAGSADQGDIPVSELAFGKLYYRLLRKPDFQRETNDWDVDNVVTLIKNFRDGQLIPALILWRCGNLTFVIDGAHRLSAFIAWVNDDYGDGDTSRRFFGGAVPEAQRRVAKECRDRIAAEVGTYTHLSNILSRPNNTQDEWSWAANMSKSLRTQWVTGDADTAERSFLAINKRAVGITETERFMIEHRRKPYVLAARSLVRAALGHEYWSHFGDEKKAEIKKFASHIHNVLFQPENEDAARSIELPVAGQPYTEESLRIALDVITRANGIRISDHKEIKDDDAGDATIRLLEKTYGVVKYIAGPGPASLALHPGVYFWNASGTHAPAAFLAIIEFVKQLNEKQELNKFTEVRSQFEEFLVSHSEFTRHILRRYGGWNKSVPSVISFYQFVYESVCNGESDEQISQKLYSDIRFVGLKEIVGVAGQTGNARITRETKAAVRRRELLASAPRCSICGARLPSTAFSYDHKIRVSDGGRGTEENTQLTHPYCNHGYKEWAISRERATATR